MDALPQRFPSPFDELAPHPRAREQAEALIRELASGWIAPGLPSTGLSRPGAGKMFGVLVTADRDGTLGCLRAFSGMLEGRWEVEGFVPPAFDAQLRAQLEPAGEAVVKGLLAREEALERSPERMELRATVEQLRERHAAQLEQLRVCHQRNKEARQHRRTALPGPFQDAAERARASEAIDQESRGDKAERRRLELAQQEERARVEPRLAVLERRLAALARLRRIVSRSLMKQLHDTYRLPNARGEERLLRSLFDGGEPPSGAGDCAAPKLLAAAFRRGLRPIALAEFWWGGPPLGGGRRSGDFYPACRGKCGPVLPFMLQGLEVAPARTMEAIDPAPAQVPLRIVYEDAWLVIVDKPAGVLSVPGRETTHAPAPGVEPIDPRDSVRAQLRLRHPHATGPLLVHRLDQDTSGLLVAALDARSHSALQRQFEQREVRKRYVAWVEGDVEGARGTIELALRGDLDDRPRQLHDPLHGKSAVTDWEVLERRDGRTRVALFPRTGRTHQLRVHCAHPLGLGAPIVGDRLYGARAERLLLHAESLGFVHPGTGAPVTFERPAPF